MKVKTYMIAVYAVLVKNGKREIEELPEAYIIPVAEYLAISSQIPASAARTIRRRLRWRRPGMVLQFCRDSVCRLTACPD